MDAGFLKMAKFEAISTDLIVARGSGREREKERIGVETG